MTTFYLVRHGETQWNQEQRLQGWLDSPLTENGRAAAERLHKQLQQIPFAAAYCSSSGRARETMAILTANRQLPIVYEDDLREIYLGEWQGHTIEEIMATNKLDYELYTNYPAQFIATHTESFGAVTERAMFTLKKIAAQYRDESILIVSHAVTIKCIINAILQHSISELWTAPYIHGTSVTVIERQAQQWLVQDIGNLHHLQ
ncbi:MULTISPECIES: histidine phosphatase family protein [Lysinibacillus]|uniref:Histidine phosphatase family protein n=1 Tax=Lysinibacillus fusiformis TaxID=28031 RepID=A0A2I0UYR8_9BACI|nr:MULTISPECIES: histidine phosphatase family protein [Lysinibacillus]MEE3809145.1 histidine phosphatase family protein [Lysinibacillus fusiformis]PKU51166.1 histidine phosphatase family protein [Lysinibacillus fusiformis]SCY11862.1 probable phosphoglycerate mutase [Lysinibacillus sp. SG9]SDB12321.1 probable phosphoglycerate mutase [Lysinibacillus sp. TC-37]SFS49837.1 probable phosphoglycerate mutase [Lysinibacillus sp. SG55]